MINVNFLKDLLVPIIKEPISFTSLNFSIFFIVCFFGYWLFHEKPRLQNIFLMVICYLFYGLGNWISLFILIIFTIFNYGCGRFLENEQNQNQNAEQNKKAEINNKWIITTNIIINLVFLGIFKYFNFISSSIVQIFSFFNIQLDLVVLNSIAPLGISFFVFSAISYNVDVFKHKSHPIYDFLTFAIYIAYFPKIIAGPIERSSDFVPQIEKEKIFDWNDFSSGLYLILIGLFKKLVIADIIAFKINDLYINPLNFGSIDTFFMVWLYSIQIYADFSGYTDMARGYSRFLGITLVENFEQPYLSTDIQMFWRKWHISLSSWIRDYIYIPLGGNRKGTKRTYYNIIITMILAGIWHGAGLNFIIWGLLHGIYQAIYRLYSQKKREKNSNINNIEYKKMIFLKLFGWFLTFQLVSIAWIFFRAPTITIAFTIIQQFIKFDFSLNYPFWNNQYLSLVIFYGLTIIIIDFLQNKFETHEIIGKYHWSLRGIIIGLIIISIIIFQLATFLAPFIYQQF